MALTSLCRGSAFVALLVWPELEGANARGEVLSSFTLLQEIEGIDVRADVGVR